MAEETHILRGSEEIESSGLAVFKVLTDLSQNYQQFASSTISVDVLTPGKPFGKGFKWRESRRVLFLREQCIFTVTEYNEEGLTYGVCLDDGYNQVLYNFEVQPRGPDSSTVNYTVDCRTRWCGDVLTCQPSERLAKMMEKQDGLLVKRLKAHIESGVVVPCC